MTKTRDAGSSKRPGPFVRVRETARRCAAASRLAAVLFPLAIVAIAGCGMGTNKDVDMAAAPAPVVTIVSVTDDVAAGTPLEFQLRVQPAPRADLTVNVTVDPGGCTLAQSPPSTVTFASGDEEATLKVQTSVVAVGADGCAVTVAIASGEGYRLGEDAETSARATITPAPDTGSPQQPAVTVAAGTSPVTEGTDVSFTLTATPEPVSPLTVNVSWSLEGSFLTGNRPPTLTIPTSGTATLTAETDDDDVDEPDGSVKLTVGTGTGYSVDPPSSAIVTVTDNDEPDVPDEPDEPDEPVVPDGPVVTIAASTASPVTEGADVSFTLTATPEPDSPLTVTIGWFGAEFLPADTPGTVTIPESGTATVTETTIDDLVDERNGRVTVSIEPGTGYTVGTPSLAEVTIQDND